MDVQVETYVHGEILKRYQNANNGYLWVVRFLVSLFILLCIIWHFAMSMFILLGEKSIFRLEEKISIQFGVL